MREGKRSEKKKRNGLQRQGQNMFTRVQIMENLRKWQVFPTKCEILKLFFILVSCLSIEPEIFPKFYCNSLEKWRNSLNMILIIESLNDVMIGVFLYFFEWESTFFRTTHHFQFAKKFTRPVSGTPYTLKFVQHGTTSNHILFVVLTSWQIRI